MTFSARDLELEMCEPGDLAMVRLFKRTGGEWDEPPAAYREMRCDPPVGKKNDYALLYTGDRIEVIAAECGILTVDRQNNWFYDDAMTKAYWVARYQFTKPALFIPVDANRSRLNIDRKPFVPGYGPWQEAAHDLWSRFGTVAHGLSWWSMHRHQPGRVYALWHQHKPTIGLIQPTGPFDKLGEDAEWKALLAANPDFTRLVGTGSTAAPSPTPPAAGP